MITTGPRCRCVQSLQCWYQIFQQEQCMLVINNQTGEECDLMRLSLLLHVIFINQVPIKSPNSLRNHYLFRYLAFCYISMKNACDLYDWQERERHIMRKINDCACTSRLIEWMLITCIVLGCECNWAVIKISINLHRGPEIIPIFNFWFRLTLWDLTNYSINE